MQLLFLIIKRIELVDDIMQALASAGVRGGTVLDSLGMAKSISEMDNLPAISALRTILHGVDPAQESCFSSQFRRNRLRQQERQ